MQERIGPAPFLERPRAAGEFITQLAKPVQQALMQRTVLLCRNVICPASGELAR